MKKNVYPRLRAQMALRGYSVKSLSEASGIRYHTLSRKIRGEFDFTLREAAQLQKTLAFDGALETLFDSGEGAQR